MSIFRGDEMQKGSRWIKHGNDLGGEGIEAEEWQGWGNKRMIWSWMEEIW